MSDQLINSAYDETKPKAVVEYDRKGRPKYGKLVAGVRVDELPATEAARLAAEGKFYPFTTDRDGNLRVTFPTGSKVETTELEVLLRIEALLIENRDLLLKIA